eukprot:XP_001693696.1 L-galactono-1,4-lactone dehydrogenase [Chlamydomonas reinhardtii]
MYYAYTNPDKEALVGKRYPPELQYLAAQQTPNTDTLVNWSGTHEATPPLARVSFGSLGVLTQATLRVVRRHQLIERTFTASPAEVKRNHVRWLQENKHIKWVLRKLYASVAGSAADPDPGAGMGATALRDVNAAEADYWRRATGTRVGWSDQILGFDCGGQQWVLEVAFQVAPSLDALKPGAQTRDLQFMDDLLAEIKKNKIAAASPLEPALLGGRHYVPAARAGEEGGGHGRTRLMPKYNAAWHWAKLEAGAASGRPEAEMAAVVRPRLAARYGPALAALKRYRAVLDPAGTCGSDWTDATMWEQTHQQLQLSRDLEAHLQDMLSASKQLSRDIFGALERLESPQKRFTSAVTAMQQPRSPKLLRLTQRAASLPAETAGVGRAAPSMHDCGKDRLVPPADDAAAPGLRQLLWAPPPTAYLYVAEALPQQQQSCIPAAASPATAATAAAGFDGSSSRDTCHDVEVERAVTASAAVHRRQHHLPPPHVQQQGQAIYCRISHVLVL